MSITAYWGAWALIGAAMGIYGYIISRPSKKKDAPTRPTMAYDSMPRELRKRDGGDVPESPGRG